MIRPFHLVPSHAVRQVLSALSPKVRPVPPILSFIARTLPLVLAVSYMVRPVPPVHPVLSSMVRSVLPHLSCKVRPVPALLSYMARLSHLFYPKGSGLSLQSCSTWSGVDRLSCHILLVHTCPSYPVLHGQDSSRTLSHLSCHILYDQDFPFSPLTSLSQDS
jgi:hypothetical protein